MIHTVTIPFGEDRELVLETGRVAGQAAGSVLAKIGGTVVMANVVHSKEPSEQLDFFPLMVDYREKHYATGRIPGNFFRREGRPGTPETINARLIDRTIRPLFPKGFKYEVQVFLTVLSMDQINPPAIPALIAASAAISISDLPFAGPVGAARIGRVAERFVVNPTFAQRDEGDLDVVAAGTRSAINMVESGSKGVSEQVILDALRRGHDEIATVVERIDRLVAECGRAKMTFEPREPDPETVGAVEEEIRGRFTSIDAIREKPEREAALRALREGTIEKLIERFVPEAGGETETAKKRKDMGEVFDQAYRQHVRTRVVGEGVRADGRSLTEIRPISVEAPFLPMTHGSALFTRGQTQSLGVVTLGTIADQRKIDDLMGFSTERFMLHYNFPPYCVGETRRNLAPGRRELGHGMLAQRALGPILPDHERFPYTIRIVSETLESNGSSSMASVCSGCLSLMDAGVPIQAPVAGIAMGLIKEGDGTAILTDIMGMEDYLGDMDFKVAGTRDGVTALQMDIKIEGLDFDILKKALSQALEARLRVLDEMAKTLSAPRAELSPLAPRIETMKIDPQRIGDLIGPSGKHIRGICEATGAQVDVEEDGTVYICTNEPQAMEQAKQMISDLTADVELGKIYTGKVVRITDFGCFVEILPKKDGLVHVSELDFDRVERVEDVCREGDMMKVKVIDIDPTGRVRLSRKEALAEDPQYAEQAQAARARSEQRRDRSGDSGSPRRGGPDRGAGSGRGSKRPDSGETRPDRGGRDRPARDRGGHTRGGDRR